MKGFVHHNIIKSTRQVMVMSVLEIVIISAGLSLDVFVAMAYMGAGFSKINKKNLFDLCLLFGCSMGVSDCRKSAYSVADIPGFFKFKFTNCRSLGGSDSSDIYRIRHIYDLEGT